MNAYQWIGLFIVAVSCAALGYALGAKGKWLGWAMTILTGVVLILVSGCAYTGSKTATVFCQAADTYTTVRALDLGAKEANPLLGQDPERIVAIKAGITGFLLWKHDEIGPKANTFINALTCGAAAHNLGVIREQKRINAQSAVGIRVNF